MLSQRKHDLIHAELRTAVNKRFQAEAKYGKNSTEAAVAHAKATEITRRLPKAKGSGPRWK
jgi:hypothetical protein